MTANLSAAWSHADLDRCQHGRHSIDNCDDCPGGLSLGNKFLGPYEIPPRGMPVRIGTTVHGKPIVVVPSRVHHGLIVAGALTEQPSREPDRRDAFRSGRQQPHNLYLVNPDSPEHEGDRQIGAMFCAGDGPYVAAALNAIYGHMFTEGRRHVAMQTALPPNYFSAMIHQPSVIQE
jgi:hypothetical protein